MEQTDKTSLQEGENTPVEEEDEARSRSLTLGGGGLKGPSVFNKYFTFLGEVRDELKKVSWPTRKTVVTETIVVIVVVIFFTSLITGLDQVLSFGFNKLLFGK